MNWTVDRTMPVAIFTHCAIRFSCYNRLELMTRHDSENFPCLDRQQLQVNADAGGSPRRKSRALIHEKQLNNTEDWWSYKYSAIGNSLISLFEVPQAEFTGASGKSRQSQLGHSCGILS